MLKIKLNYSRNFLKEKYFNILSSVLGEFMIEFLLYLFSLRKCYAYLTIKVED